MAVPEGVQRAQWIERVREVIELSKMSNGKQRRDVAIARAEAQGLDPYVTEGHFEKKHKELPRFPSTLGDRNGIRDDCLTFQGYTALAGSSGGGKSLLALSAALRSAHEGVGVVWLDIEGHKGSVRKRIANWYDSRPVFEKQFLQGVNEQTFFYRKLKRHAAFDNGLEVIKGLVQPNHDGLLIVIDSASKLVRRSIGSSKIHPLEKLDMFDAWAEYVVDETDGFIRVLALMELNQEGKVKGGTGTVFSSHVSLQLDKEPGQGAHAVHIRCLKNRDEEDDDPGLYTIDYMSTRLVPRERKSRKKKQLDEDGMPKPSSKELELFG